jgi:hypothetical protein
LKSENVAVAIAVNKNTITATKDRNENLGIPHKPCPLVHPLENSVPRPTSAPEIIKRVIKVD